MFGRKKMSHKQHQDTVRLTDVIKDVELHVTLTVNAEKNILEVFD